jgi:hypothetical protein
MTAYEHEDIMSCHGLYDKTLLLFSFIFACFCFVSGARSGSGSGSGSGSVSWRIRRGALPSCRACGRIICLGVRYILNCLLSVYFFHPMALHVSQPD